MTTIGRLNTTINNSTPVANAIAFSLLAMVTVASAAAINHGGELVKASYDSLTATTSSSTAPLSLTQAPAAKIQSDTTALTIAASFDSTAPLSLQSQQPNVIGQLQPAQGIDYNTQANASTLQPASSNIQLTGSNLQNAIGL